MPPGRGAPAPASGASAAAASGRHPADLAGAGVALAGVGATVAGLALVAGSEAAGFDLPGVASGIASQLALTLPAAVLVAGAAALDRAAGLSVVRAVRGAPFASPAEALVAATGLRLRPMLAAGSWGPPRIGLAGGLLVAIAWAGPTLLQLASPVPPLMDVLPNHVGPVAHLSAYGA